VKIWLLPVRIANVLILKSRPLPGWMSYKWQRLMEGTSSVRARFGLWGPLEFLLVVVNGYEGMENKGFAPSERKW
jgi:hypothetical protein